MSTNFRVGIGFDFHRLSSGRRLVLGGVVIPFEFGLEGHSDADVVLHAVTDAILGAAGLEDIGTHFPDDDPAYENISSLVLLAKILEMIQARGFQIGNVDLTVMAEKPRLQPYIENIKATLSRALELDSSRIGLKATTMEKSGPIGRGEGIAAQAVVLLVGEDITP